MGLIVYEDDALTAQRNFAELARGLSYFSLEEARMTVSLMAL